MLFSSAYVSPVHSLENLYNNLTDVKYRVHFLQDRWSQWSTQLTLTPLLVRYSVNCDMKHLGRLEVKCRKLFCAFDFHNMADHTGTSWLNAVCVIEEWYCSYWHASPHPPQLLLSCLCGCSTSLVSRYIVVWTFRIITPCTFSYLRYLIFAFVPLRVIVIVHHNNNNCVMLWNCDIFRDGYRTANISCLCNPTCLITQPVNELHPQWWWFSTDS